MHSYAIFSAEYAPHVGGIETFTSNLAHELVKKGNSVVVITSRLDRSPEMEEQLDGVKVLRLPCVSFMGGRLPVSKRNKRCRNLLGQISELKVDRVLVNARFYEHSILGLDYAKTVHAQAIVLDHGSAYLTFGSMEKVDWILRCYEHVMTARARRRGPSFAGISSKSAKWLETFGVYTSTVIPNAINAEEFCEESSRKDYRRAYHCEDKTLIVYVGRLTEEKGPRQLIEAARLLGDSFEIILAGDGALRQSLESNLPHNVELVGNLSHPDLSALLSQADIFCLPTRSEGYCTSLLEAGSWGVPCVVPNVGGAQEVLRDESGQVFGIITSDRLPETIATAIRQVRSTWSPAKREEMRKHILTHCSWEHTVSALEEAFAEASRT